MLKTCRDARPCASTNQCLTVIQSEISYSQIKERDFNPDISWLKDENLEDPYSLPEPQLLVADAITGLGACVDELQLILDEIEQCAVGRGQ